MDYELMFPSRYIKACDLQGRDVTLTIKDVAIDELVRRGGAKEQKGVVHFAETEKMWVLNRTNADSVADLYGRDTDEWIGKRVTLHPARVQFGRQTVDAIRVRPKVPPPKVKHRNNEPPAGAGDAYEPEDAGL